MLVAFAVARTPLESVIASTSYFATYSGSAAGLTLARIQIENLGRSLWGGLGGPGGIWGFLGVS